MRQVNVEEIINTNNAPAPIGPYNQAVKFGNFLFLSGQVALRPDTGEMANKDISEETHQVMQNLKAVLAEGGMNFSHVVKTTIFLKDMNNFVQVNEAYGSFFTKEFPARATIEAPRLPKDANVEICMEAVK